MLPNATEGIERVEEARKWLGVPYLKKGRSTAGVDCVGLVAMVCGTDFLDYPDSPPSAFVFRHIRDYADRVSEADAEPGDIALIFDRAGSTHIGIKTDGGIIHASNIIGKVVEHRVDDKSIRIAGYFKLKEVLPSR